MKISLRHITLCTAVTASIVTGCAWNGKTADTDVQDTAAKVAENAPEAEKAEAGITEADEDNGLYTARHSLMRSCSSVRIHWSKRVRSANGVGTSPGVQFSSRA